MAPIRRNSTRTRWSVRPPDPLGRLTGVRRGRVPLCGVIWRGSRVGGLELRPAVDQARNVPWRLLGQQVWSSMTWANRAPEEKLQQHQSIPNYEQDDRAGASGRRPIISRLLNWRRKSGVANLITEWKFFLLCQHYTSMKSKLALYVAASVAMMVALPWCTEAALGLDVSLQDCGSCWRLIFSPSVFFIWGGRALPRGERTKG